MAAQPQERVRKRLVWFSPLLLVVALSPVLLQTGMPLSCSGDSRLAVLEVNVDGVNELVFDSNERYYSLSLPAISSNTALVRAFPIEPSALVSVIVQSDSAGFQGMWREPGGGEDIIPLAPGLNSLRVFVYASGGASGAYNVGIQVGCVDCDDGNECTTDACDPAVEMCVHTPVGDGEACDFGGLPGSCSAGLCEEGLCAGVDCDDGNECTNDTCDPAVGECLHTPDTDASCAGGSGSCDASGACVSFCAGVDCDDGNECTDDSCVASSEGPSCVNTELADGTACDFGGLPGLCFAGVCEGDASCPVLTSVTVVPLQAGVGDQINVMAEASDAQGDMIDYLWTGSGGVFADPTAASTTYTCLEIEQHDINIAVSDDGFTNCIAELTLTIECLPVCTDDGDCDDGNVCTANACEAGGTCSATATNDGECCPSGIGSGGGTCAGGFCVSNDTCVVGADCAGGNQCTEDVCTFFPSDPITFCGGFSACFNLPEPAGTSCDAGGGPGSGACDGAGVCADAP